MLLCLSSGTDLQKSRHVLKSLSLCNKVLSYLSYLSPFLSPLSLPLSPSLLTTLFLSPPSSLSLSVSSPYLPLLLLSLYLSLTVTCQSFSFSRRAPSLSPSFCPSFIIPPLSPLPPAPNTPPPSPFLFLCKLF